MSVDPFLFVELLEGIENAINKLTHELRIANIMKIRDDFWGSTPEQKEDIRILMKQYLEALP